MKNIKKLAFTLAETLIVMGVIGIIASLTVPNLLQSTNDRDKVVRLKKTYNSLVAAHENAIANYGPIEDWFLTPTTRDAQIAQYANRLTEFMKISKKCESGSGCYDKSEVYLDNTSGPSYKCASKANRRFVLADGVPICVTFNQDQSAIRVYVDIDPKRGKGVFGKDLFTFGAKYNDSNMGFAMSVPTTQQYCFQSGHCAWWVINYENFDYTKVDSNRKCPNGKVLNETANPPVTSCS